MKNYWLDGKCDRKHPAKSACYCSMFTACSKCGRCENCGGAVVGPSIGGNSPTLWIGICGLIQTPTWVCGTIQAPIYNNSGGPPPPGLLVCGTIKTPIYSGPIQSGHGDPPGTHFVYHLSSGPVSSGQLVIGGGFILNSGDIQSGHHTSDLTSGSIASGSISDYRVGVDWDDIASGQGSSLTSIPSGWLGGDICSGQGDPPSFFSGQIKSGMGCIDPTWIRHDWGKT